MYKIKSPIMYNKRIVKVGVISNLEDLNKSEIEGLVASGTIEAIEIIDAPPKPDQKKSFRILVSEKVKDSEGKFLAEGTLIDSDYQGEKSIDQMKSYNWIVEVDDGE